MRITVASIFGMCYALENGVKFTRTAMLGRQNLYITKEKLNAVLERYDPFYTCTHESENWKEIFDSLFAAGSMPYAEKLFQYFGAKEIDSIDYNDYEGATIIHDMNTPIGENLKNKFSCVWDGGTLEHVFNYPAAIRNAMDMVEPGGHLILETPANNLCGHGLYQFSPELFFSLLDIHNGFNGTKIFMQDDKDNWYEVISPVILKSRNQFCLAKRKESNMLVIAEKISSVPEAITCLQSDYVMAWNNQGQTEQSAGKIPSGKIKYLYKKIVPKQLRDLKGAILRKISGEYSYRKQLLRYYKPTPSFSNPARNSGKEQSWLN